MIYITNDKLPENFRNDGGLNLCKLWFYTLMGHDIKDFKKDLKNFKDDFMTMEEVSQYRIVNQEILLLKNTYCVGNGLGNIVYSPCRLNEDVTRYLNGEIGITKKYEVTLKD